MNTIQLECFLAVGRHLNFSKAAEEIKITQPAVSHQIRSLEEELGVKLFLRTSKSVSARGTAFFPGRGSNPENYRLCQRSAPQFGRSDPS